MRFKRLIAALFCTIAASSYAETNLLQITQDAKVEQQQSNRLREASFKSKEQQYRQKRDALLARKAQLQTDIDTLSEQFTANEQQLAEQEKKLHLESGSLGELFGVVRQVAKNFQAQQTNSVTAIGAASHLDNVAAIVDAKTLPSRDQLYALWDAFNDQLEHGARNTRITVPFINQEGITEPKDVIRLGAFGLIDESGYLIWSGNERGARPYAVQPKHAPLLSEQSLATSLVALDPSNGLLLGQLSSTPTLTQRIAQGGAIAKVILGLLVIGLIIGLLQGTFLFIHRAQIRTQLKNREDIGNNALGRILSVYKYDKSPNVEALELRLYETVLDEQQKLERGLSMLKLLAALSPMLGLLGTVTGMIETFQVITRYGNADPRMMASGISTALVTTVLGLIAAMPLLFIHNVLTSQAENIRTLLEKQGVGLVAQRAEQQAEQEQA